ncbi:MAG: hypothetical protein KIT54_10175 [Phycisphaeraceae bacterium]|nr:hypothetical protein [Phycisphaeraceae bacterium]
MSTGAHVMCDTPISQLRSATPAVVMSLNKKGISTVGDLLAASFDEVAYQLDSFDDAEVLIQEAKQAANSKPTQPSAQTAQEDAMSQPAPDERPQKAPAAAPSSAPRSKPNAPKATSGQVGLATAMQAVLSLDGGAFASMEASSAAAQRLAAAALIIQHGGGEDEAVAAGLLDTIDPKAPCVDRNDAAVRFGEPAVDLLERAELLLTVPMSPSGKPSNVHAKLVEVADDSAMLVAACGAIASARAVLARFQSSGDAAWNLFKGGREFAVWYFGSIGKALGPALKKAEREGLAHELWSVVRALEATGGPDRKAA